MERKDYTMECTNCGSEFTGTFNQANDWVCTCEAPEYQALGYDPEVNEGQA